MNKISFCNKEDINDLISFIDTHWKKDHIFVKNKELFNFQHKNDDQYNFVISRNQNNKINGILGFIPNYKFDSSLKKSSCVWLAIWKVDESIAEHGLGIVLLRWLEEKLNPDMIGTVGQNYNVNPLYKALGYETGELNHFFYINDEIKKFKIIKNVKSIKK